MNVARQLFRSGAATSRRGFSSDVIKQKKFNQEYARQTIRPPNTGLTFIYTNFMRRAPMLALLIVTGAIGSEILFDSFSDRAWKSLNKGRLFEDVIPSRFPNLPPGTGDEDEDEDEDDEEEEAEEEAEE